MSAETKNFIAGKWVATGSTFGSVNPATGELVSRCAEASQQELDAAVAAACDAFPAWRKTPPPRRAEILFRVAELLKARKDDLARWITLEMGKVTMEARGDVQEAIDMARYMAGEGRRMFGHTAPSELPDKFCMSLRDPIGVVAVITPWNFPIAVPSWKILPAFVLGNTVVWKPSSDTPVCAAKFVEAFVEAGLPPGVLNLVLGKGAEIGDALVRHRDVRLVTFTGSNEVGHRVSVTAAETGKRCALEMGGKNAIIVLDDADLALAVDGIVWSAFGTSGQRCTAASRIIVHNTVRGPLTELLLERIKQLKIGNGLDPPTTVGPVINHAALEKIDRYVHIGLDEGSRLLVGGERFSEGDCRRGCFYCPTVFDNVTPAMRIARDEIFGPVINHAALKKFDRYVHIGLNEGARLLIGGERFSKGDCRRGCFYRPTVFDNVTPAMRIARDEIFGPVVCIIEAGSLEEAVAINNDVPYGLVSSIYTQNINHAFAAMRELTTGIVYVNAGTIGSEVQLPFGGTRGTGNGAREAGQAALDTFSEWKTVYVDYSGRLQRAQIDTETTTQKEPQNENSRTQISSVRPGPGKTAARIRG